jgi:Flp pilus assembly protein TadG
MKSIQRTPGESGQVIVLLALLMIVLLGFAGLAIDGGNVLTQRRRAQNAADNAALAYALKRNQGQNDSTGASAMNTILSSNGYVSGTGNTSTSYSTTSSSSGGTVTLVLTSTVPTAFIHIVYSGPVQYTVQAQAQWVSSVNPMAGFAVVGLSTSCGNNDGVLDISGGGNDAGINAHNGHMFMNVSGTASCAIALPNSNNNGGITTDQGYNIYSVGSTSTYTNNNNSATATPNYNGGTSISDPLAGISAPSCTTTPSNSSSPYYPGYISGSTLSNGGVLKSGIYCVSGEIRLTGQNSLTLEDGSNGGVVLYLMDDGIEMAGQGGLTLYAPTTSNCGAMRSGTSSTFASPYQAQAVNNTANPCTYAGMVIFSRNGASIDIRGNSGTATTGTIYAPNSLLRAKGGGSDSDETTIVGQAIVGKVQNTGNGTFDITYQEPQTYIPPPYIRLTK